MSALELIDQVGNLVLIAGVIVVIKKLGTIHNDTNGNLTQLKRELFQVRAQLERKK